MGKQGGSDCCEKENAIKYGRFRRVSDGRWIQRYRCKKCQKSFSQACYDPAYYQKKRHLNHPLMLLLSSSVSMRRSALILGVHPITVARKLEYLATQSREKLAKEIEEHKDVVAIQFDELLTIEHTKCKPLSIAMAVSVPHRKILGFEVSRMPATGYLASISRKKYGPRKDERFEGMDALFQHLQQILGSQIEIRSDMCPYYGSVVNHYFPKASYQQFKGEKSSTSGQGELKKVKKDPLFSINHSFAMLRANINRLVRRTWCTTKKISRLIDHLSIYAWVHNSRLTASIKPATI